MNTLKSAQKIYRKVKKRFSSNQRQLDSLYRLLYNLSHDNEQAIDLAGNQTVTTFSKQWEKYSKGVAMLDNEWFKENVDNIIVNEELQMKREWFKGKKVLDGGCGNGRWAYGYAKLGVDLTCVDINENALNKTKENIHQITQNAKFIQSPLENVKSKFPENTKFDLVYSWGVVHHATSFNKSLDNLCSLVKNNGGVLHLYLYGRESKNYNDDIELFKDRLYYNTLETEEEKLSFLLKKAKGNKMRVNAMHDYYAPLINRRLEFSYVEQFLKDRGFTRIDRTKKHTELYIRAFKGDYSELEPYILPLAQPPYWFQHYQSKWTKMLAK